MYSLDYRRLWLNIIALVIILAFAFQGSRGLWEPDEGRYVRCAYEMLTSGDWLTPRLNGNPHFTKPPLTYWLIASGLSLFGMNEWGARFFHALAFVLTALMAGYLAARMWDQKHGLLSVLVYSTMVFPSVGANIATTDMILTLFMTGAMLSCWMSLSPTQTSSLQKTIWGLLVWLFLGLAFLTKGPPGLLPLLVGIAYLGFSRRARRPSLFAIVTGIIIFCAVALPWYILVVQKYNGLFSYFIKDEIIGRIVTGEHTRNSGLFGAFKIYPHTLLLGSLPWSCFLLAWMWKTKPRIFAAQWWKQLQHRDNAFFIVLWFLVPLFFLTISNSRLPLYMLPLFVPLALATARCIVLYYPVKACSLLQMRGKPAVWVLLLICLLTGSRAIAAHYGPKRDSRVIWEKISPVIQERIGNAPYELSVIGLQLHGITFYSGKMVETLEIDDAIGHSFSPKRNILQKGNELLSQQGIHVFLLRQKNLKKITTQFNIKGINHEIADGPFDYKLIFCQQNVVGNSVAAHEPTKSANP
jgi:4-amino-4-deoxy-L-arabinose transferase